MKSKQVLIDRGWVRDGVVDQFQCGLVKRRDRGINHLEGTEGEGITIFLTP